MLLHETTPRNNFAKGTVDTMANCRENNYLGVEVGKTIFSQNFSKKKWMVVIKIFRMIVRTKERRNSPKYHQLTKPQMVNERTRQVITFKRVGSTLMYRECRTLQRPGKLKPSQKHLAVALAEFFVFPF